MKKAQKYGISVMSKILQDIEKEIFSVNNTELDLASSYLENTSLANSNPLNERDTILLYLHYFEFITQKGSKIELQPGIFDLINSSENQKKAALYLDRKIKRVEKSATGHKKILGTKIGQRNKFFIIQKQDGLAGLILLCFVRGLTLSFLTQKEMEQEGKLLKDDDNVPTKHGKATLKAILSLPGKADDVDHMREDMKKLAVELLAASDLH